MPRRDLGRGRDAQRRRRPPCRRARGRPRSRRWHRGAAAPGARRRSAGRRPRSPTIMPGRGVARRQVARWPSSCPRRTRRRRRCGARCRPAPSPARCGRGRRCGGARGRAARPDANGSTWWRTSRTRASAAAGVRPARSSSTTRSADSSSSGGASKTGSAAIRRRPRLRARGADPDRLHRLRAAAVGGARRDAGASSAAGGDERAPPATPPRTPRARPAPSSAWANVSRSSVSRLSASCVSTLHRARRATARGAWRRRRTAPPVGATATAASPGSPSDASTSMPRLGEEAADAAGADRALLEDDGAGAELVADLRDDLRPGSGRRTLFNLMRGSLRRRAPRCRLRRRACSAGSRCTRGRRVRDMAWAMSGAQVAAHLRASRRARRGGRRAAACLDLVADGADDAPRPGPGRARGRRRPGSG